LLIGIEWDYAYPDRGIAIDHERSRSPPTIAVETSRFAETTSSR
jgi:hypothetical protein